METNYNHDDEEYYISSDLHMTLAINEKVINIITIVNMQHSLWVFCFYSMFICNVVIFCFYSLFPYLLLLLKNNPIQDCIDVYQYVIFF